VFYILNVGLGLATADLIQEWASRASAHNCRGHVVRLSLWAEALAVG